VPRKVAIVAGDAAFTKNPIEGARANAAKNGLESSRRRSTTLRPPTFTKCSREAEKSGPDSSSCSYLNDSGRTDPGDGGV